MKRKASVVDTQFTDKNQASLIEQVAELEARVRRLEELVRAVIGDDILANGLILTHEDTGVRWRAALITAGPEDVALAWDEVLE